MTNFNCLARVKGLKRSRDRKKSKHESKQTWLMEQIVEGLNIK